MSWTPPTSYIEERFADFWSRLKIPYCLISQYQIGPYYVDFCHPESGIIIELDGAAYHSSPDQIARDRYRQSYLERLNWKVIRFTGRDVYRYPARSVLRAKSAIERALRELVPDASMVSCGYHDEAL